MTSNNNNGFSLIELMIVVVIVGILTSIVMPGYQDYVMQTRRSEGISMLLQVMQQQERYFTEQLTYTEDLTELGYASRFPLSENGVYLITAGQCSNNNEEISRCVWLSAAPQGGQEGDENLTLDSRGVRTPAEFWQ